MSEWFYQLLGETLGPVSWEQLKQKVEQGEIGPDTPVRQANQQHWQVAAEIEGLCDSKGGKTLELGEIATEEVRESHSGESVETKRSPLALRPCVDCGHLVSRHAHACPNCGRLFHETSSLVYYSAEHSVPVLVLFFVLAALFVIATPVAVFLGIFAIASASGLETQGANLLAFVGTVIFIVMMVLCALLGKAVAKPRMAPISGLLLGLFLGPFGVWVASAIDRRPQCHNCMSRLDGLAHQCPYCHARLIWKVRTRWV